jgi:FAD/FMN-containing dehydrogenase
MGGTRISSPLYDYGKAHAGSETYEEITPEDLQAVMELVREAVGARRPLRVRGSGHTFSGVSLPRRGGTAGAHEQAGPLPL